MVRVIYRVHESPGRLRLRLPFLRKVPDQVDPLADRLATLDGMEQVEVKPYTGSVLCTFDPYSLDADRIVAEVIKATGVEPVLRLGERSAAEEEALCSEALSHGSDVARAFVGFFKGLNMDVIRSTEGRIDLGTLAAFGFLTAGAAEVMATGKLPLPPWFNLGWWAFRTFTTMEKRAIENAEPAEAQGAHA